MKAIVQDTFGPSNVLYLRDIDKVTGYLHPRSGFGAEMSRGVSRRSART